MHSKALFRQACYSGIRLGVFIYLSVLAANYLNGRNFSDYFSKTLIKVHAEAKIGIDSNELSRLLIDKKYAELQQLLDRNYRIYALAITDCLSEAENCNGQRILFATNPRLIWEKPIRVEELVNYPYFLLRRPSSSILQLLERKEGEASGAGEIIGRVYSISTIPTFGEDYRSWLRDPFRENELWRRYLETMAVCLLGGVSVWLIVELFLKIRRIEQRNARQRENELIKDADTYFRQLEEKVGQIEEQERRSARQFEAYIARIKELEQKLRNVDEYREIAETIIKELEDEKAHQSVIFRDQLEKTNQEKQRLQGEVEKYRKASGKEKEEASRALANAITFQTGNPLEQRVMSAILNTPKFQRGDWRAVNNFDVSVGRGGSRFIDCIVITRECLIVLEVKNYFGSIEAEGDPENSGWLCRDGNRVVAVKSDWGENPYHQVHEYAMSLLNLVKRRLSQLPVYGVVVFPDITDISRLEGRIGKFYRITTVDRLIAVLEQIEAEARRDNAFTKRPSPEQVENLIRGKKV